MTEKRLDAIKALEDMEVDKKIIRLLYKLNEKTEIKVGVTESAQVGVLVGQGSGAAAIGSQAMVNWWTRP